MTGRKLDINEVIYDNEKYTISTNNITYMVVLNRLFEDNNIKFGYNSDNPYRNQGKLFLDFTFTFYAKEDYIQAKLTL